MENLKKHEGEETIPRDVPERLGYRYWMPILQVKVEGRGNGRTIITNLNAIAKSLDRPPAYLMKYIGIELGTRTAEQEPYVVPGGYSAESLAKLLDGFIAKYVICKTDRNPETTIGISSKGEIRLKCKACGSTTVADMNHKMASYIVKNPPSSDKKDGGKKTKAEKRAEKIKKQQLAAKQGSSESSDDG
jgi:translation initiation factor 5